MGRYYNRSQSRAWYNQPRTFVVCQSCWAWRYHDRIGSDLRCKCGEAWPEEALAKARELDRKRTTRSGGEASYNQEEQGRSAETSGTMEANSTNAKALLQQLANMAQKGVQIQGIEKLAVEEPEARVPAQTPAQAHRAAEKDWKKAVQAFRQKFQSLHNTAGSVNNLSAKLQEARARLVEGQEEIKELAKAAQEATGRYLAPPEATAEEGGDKDENGKDKKDKKKPQPSKEESDSWKKVEELVTVVAKTPAGPGLEEKEKQLVGAITEVVAATRQAVAAKLQEPPPNSQPGEAEEDNSKNDVTMVDEQGQKRDQKDVKVEDDKLPKKAKAVHETAEEQEAFSAQQNVAQALHEAIATADRALQASSPMGTVTSEGG